MLLAVAGGCLLSPTLALGSFSGGDGVIAYSANGDIWAVDPVTEDQLELTSGGGDSNPSFSPSGNLLLFQRGSGVFATIYLAQADGRNPRALINGSEPAFSPGGKHLVFVSAKGLYVGGLTPDPPVHRITSNHTDRNPRWAQNGLIAFQRSGEAGTQLDVVSASGRDVRTLLDYNYATEATWPDWSPNGKILAAALCFQYSSFAGNPGLETYPQLTLHRSCAPAVWAPDGSPVLAEPGVKPLAGRPDTTCPAVLSGLYVQNAISWQPLHPGTLRVPTAPCQPHAEPPRYPATGGPPPPRTLTVCVHSRKRHRRVCIHL